MPKFVLKFTGLSSVFSIALALLVGVFVGGLVAVAVIVNLWA